MSTSVVVQTTISPVLRYRDARRAIDWLSRAFDFRPRAVYDGPDGTVAHAELEFETGVIGLSSAGGLSAGNPWTGVRQGIYSAIPDVDRHHDVAEAAGASIVMPLQDMDYGSREYTAVDLAGRLWGFGTYQMAAPGRQNVFVCLRYLDAPAAMAWLERVFGFQRGLVVPGGDGTVAHAELHLGDAVLMLSSRTSPGPWGDEDQCTCIHTADPDAHHARAASASAAILQAPIDTPYGARCYLARDPEGFLWDFSTYRPGHTTGATGS